MSKNANAASRLHQILSAASGIADSIPVVKAWGDILGIEEQNDNRKAILISEHLNWLHRELEIVRAQMKEMNFSEEVYANSLNKVEYAISALLLPSTWSSCKQYLAADTLVALNFCSEILPDEESQIDPSDLKSIEALVGEVRELLVESQLPASLKRLVQHHINLIQDALDQYPIFGAMAFREAARTGLGEIIEMKDSIKDQQGTEEISKLGTLWEKVNQTADAAIKVDGVIQIGQKAWAFLQQIL